MYSGVMCQCQPTITLKKEFKCVEKGVELWVSTGLQRGT